MDISKDGFDADSGKEFRLIQSIIFYSSFIMTGSKIRWIALNH